MPKTNQDLLSLEEREKEEFSKRVESLVKKEKQALVRRETGMSLLSPFTSILAVMVAKGPAWLGAFIMARQASEFGHELKNLQEMADYRILGSKLFLEFAREADASMPEVERDVKKADKLKSNISQVSNEAVAYVRSKTAVIGGVAGITIAVATSTIPTLMNVATLGVGGVLSSLATIGGITTASALASVLIVMPKLKKRRELNAKLREGHIKDWSAVEDKKHDSLSNPALKQSTNASEKSFQKLDETMKKEVSTLKKGIGFMGRISSVISLSSLGITTGVGLACYFTGIRNFTSMSMVVMSANVLNNSLKQILNARSRLKETSDSMYDHYREFRHNKIYELSYGNEKAPDNTYAIQLKNVCYHLRETDGPNVGRRLPQPLIQSDRTITFRPGINILGGSSGCGKSTLYRLLRHADDTTLGSVSYGYVDGNGEFQGVQTTDMPKNEVYKHIAFAFQSIENEKQTALDIIQQGNPDLDVKFIKQAAESIDLALYQETLEGTKPKMFAPLSDGEKNRVLFLQAILSPKRILVFDEPTAGVPEATRDKMIACLDNDTCIIDGVPQKRTIIYTTHLTSDLRKFKNITQAVEMSPITDEKKISSFVQKFGIGTSRLPSEFTVYPCQTEEEKEAYIDLARSHNPSNHREELSEFKNAWCSIGAAIGATMSRQSAQKDKVGQKTESDEIRKGLDMQLLRKISGNNDTI